MTVIICATALLFGPSCARGGPAIPIPPRPRGGAAVLPSNVEVGQAMAESEYGWTGAEWVCTYEIANHESGWDETAWNHGGGSRSDPAADPYGAYGIPQSHPPSKLASAGPDWRTSAVTQIRWYLRYLKLRWGSPCAAWAHWRTGAGGYTY